MTLLCVAEKSGHNYESSQRKPTHGIYPRSYDTYKMLPDRLYGSTSFCALAATTQCVGLYNLILGYGFLSQFHSLHMQNSKNRYKEAKCPFVFSLVEDSKYQI